MRISQAGIDFIKRQEQLRLTAYLDTIAKPPVYTIGYGVTGPEIVEGLVWTNQQAESELQTRLEGLGNSLTALIKYPVSQGQFDAMMSLAWNIGLGALSSSTLLSKFNAGDVRGAALEFIRWDHAGGVEVLGLRNRRLHEMVTFCGL